jgi:broad specificity phosphatase PhoE
VPLSARGVAEVRRLEQHLRLAPPFEAIYASPLQRAWSTATALAESGLGAVYPCPLLQEIDCGLLEGLPLSVVTLQYQTLWEANLRQDDERFRWPGGESYRELRGRTWRALHRLATVHRGDRIALVTHAGVVSQVFGAIAGLSPARWEAFRPGTAAVSEIEWMRGRVRVVRFDERSHLPSPGELR